MTLYQENLVENLISQIFCRLAPSEIDGIGVIAIKDIPKDTEVFNICNEMLEDIIELTDEDLDGLDNSISNYIQDFFIKEESGIWALPAGGLNSLNISFFLNHSDTPNLSPELSHGYATWKSNRLITVGEELTNDYRLLGPSNELVKQFPWLFTNPFIS